MNAKVLPCFERMWGKIFLNQFKLHEPQEPLVSVGLQNIPFLITLVKSLHVIPLTLPGIIFGEPFSYI